MSPSKKKWAFRAAIIGAFMLVLFAGVPMGVGALMPRDHVASGSATIAVPPETVWQTIVDFENMKAWAPDVGEVSRVPDVDGKPCFREVRDDFTLTYTFVSLRAPQELVVDLADDAGYFGGTWTYTLSPAGDGTELTITERGWAGPGFFRFMLWLFGADSTLKAHLAALQRKLGG